MKKKHYALTLFLAAIIIVAFAAVAGSGSTSDLPNPPAIGTVIDDFKLPDTGGAEHSLKSLTGKNGAVLIFISVQCPVSNGYNERMEKLAVDYKAKGVNVIGINSNVTEPIAAVKAHAADKHFTFTVLKDDGNKIADRLGATFVRPGLGDQGRAGIPLSTHPKAEKEAVAKANDVTTVIHVETDPLICAPSSESWWDVPVSEVSELDSTRAARQTYEQNKAAQRSYLRPAE